MTAICRSWSRAQHVLICIALFLLTVCRAHAENGVTRTEIILGQSTALSGPLAELGTDSMVGAKAYFDYVNTHGGVNGRTIRLITLDDGYDTERGIRNAKRLIEDEKVFALFNVIGTPANTALLPIVTKAGIPSFAPFTGSQAMRKPFNRFIFNVRASYADEVEKIVEHLRVRGVDKVAVLYQNNSMGTDGLAAMEASMGKRKLTVHASATIENDASDAAKAALKLSESKPQAIVMVTAGKTSAEFIKAYRKLGSNMQFFMLSVMGTQASVNALGKEGEGAVVSQVMPYPFSATSEIVRDYQKIMTRMGIGNRSFSSMEGFVNARVLVEGLRRAGSELTRERFISAMESMEKVDLDGYVIDFSKTNREGSRYVDLTVISKQGRLLR